jgi:hypothetical protein
MNSRIIDKRSIGNDTERSDNTLIVVPFRHLPEGTKENTWKLRITGVPEEIRMGNFSSTSQKHTT